MMTPASVERDGVDRKDEKQNNDGSSYAIHQGVNGNRSSRCSVSGRLGHRIGGFSNDRDGQAA